MEKNIKKAFELAEQEVQEKEISNLKGIIKDLLSKKSKAEEEKREIEKEISVIKQTIDDFKAGRLDKVKELIEKDSIAKDILPFSVVIINQTVINQPWKWVYQVLPTYTYPTSSYGILGNTGSYTLAAGMCGVTTTGSLSCATSGTEPTTLCIGSSDTGSNGGWSGSNFATFTSGTYDINGRIINL